MTIQGLGKFRLGYAAADHSKLTKRATCDASQIFTYPTASTSVQASDSLTIQWKSSCFTADKVDLYLYSYAPSTGAGNTKTGMIQAWKGAQNGGSYGVGKLNPGWWNNTENVNLNFAIINADTPSFLASGSPVFSMHADPSLLTSSVKQTVQTSTAADGSQVTSTDGDIYQTASLPRPSGLPKGGLVAAILVPILVVGALVGLYIKFARIREREKRKRWSEHVDRRMSQISGTDWRAGALPGEGGAPRASMVSTGTRVTSAYFNNGGARGSMAEARGASMYSVNPETNMAGQGTHRIPRIPVANQERSSTLRQSTFEGQRQSRISFADDLPRARVSMGDTLRPTKSNLSGAAPPPMPINTNRHSIDNSRLAGVSPTQAEGPAVGGGWLGALGNVVGKKDKRGKGEERERDMEQMEQTRRSEDALRNSETQFLRRSQIISQYSQHSNMPPAAHVNSNEDTDAMEELTVPVTAVGGNGSMVRSTSPMGMAPPTSGMSPDEMLKAYAAARQAKGNVGPSMDAAGTEDINPQRESGISQISTYSTADEHARR